VSGSNNHSMQDLRKQLNASQYEAVTTTEGPVLVIAGAGSGKTRVIEYRSLHLIQKGIDPESILLLTFTRRSAHEMIARASRNDARCSRIDGGTFHSFASKVLRRHSRTFGISSSFTIYDEGDAEEAIRRCCNKMGYDEDEEFPKKRELKNVFSLCLNKEMSVDDAVQKTYKDYEDRIDDIKTVRKEYAEYKLRNNCLDYDDLLTYLKLLLDNADVREKLSARYRYIMVDEFQDTNAIQAEIVRLLAQKNGNVMAVGDDAQSIYGFRGANHLNILQFPRRFPGCKVIKLEENYRSTQPILDVGNAVLTNMQHKFEKRLVSATGLVGDKPSLRRFDDIYQEAAWLAFTVQSCRASGISTREMAVLFRTAFTSMPLQAELVKRGIRFKLFGGRKFYETAHVRDVVSYLRIVANPTDELAWHRVLLLLPGIGTRTVEKFLGQISTYQSLPEIIEKVLAPQCAGGKHSGVLSSLKGLLQSINSKTMLPAGQLQQAINHYGPLMEAKYQKDPSRRKELLMLQQMALRYDSLKEFLADVAVDPDKDAHDTDLEFLTLSTVHSAKGLEWGTVFLIGLLDGVFPSGKSMLDDAGGDIEEERRLFYVAVTRAKDQLFLSLYNKSGPGGNSVSALSRFLEAENVKKTVDERKVRAAFVPVRNRAKRESRYSGR
jgi:DNA helicase II / ATP-dependent DNA helicase PcrA